MNVKPVGGPYASWNPISPRGQGSALAAFPRRSRDKSTGGKGGVVLKAGPALLYRQLFPTSENTTLRGPQGRSGSGRWRQGFLPRRPGGSTPHLPRRMLSWLGRREPVPCGSSKLTTSEAGRAASMSLATGPTTLSQVGRDDPPGRPKHISVSHARTDAAPLLHVPAPGPAMK